MNAATKGAIRSVPSTAPLDEILAIFAEDGGVILKDFVTADQVKAFNAEVEPSMRAKAPGSKVEGWEESAEFFGTNTKRFTDVVSVSKTFREEMLNLDLFHALGDAIFLEESGTYWLAAAQVIEIGPNSKAQPLHRDSEGWRHFHVLGPSAPEIGVNIIVAMTDFTDENGATRFIPGSHKWADFEDRGTPEMTVPVEMKAGDAVLYTGKAVHGGGANRTNDFYRRGIAMALIPGFLTPEDAFPLIVDKELVRPLPRRVQRLLGFRSQYPVGAPGLWQVNVGDIGEYLGL